MYIDSTLKPIPDTASYVHPETGTQYPWNYPKDKIAGLVRVTETASPQGEDIVVTGYTIDENYTQVWTVREKTSEEKKAALKSQAISLLNQTDMTILRCVEAGIDVPQVWYTYRNDLRDVVRGNTDTIPEQPSYPEGT